MSVISNEPSSLYHYTSQTGLLGVIKTKSIWATNILYLNDMTEFIHAVELFQNEVSRFRKSIQNNLEIEFLEYLSSFIHKDIAKFTKTGAIEELMTPHSSFDLYGTYVCSFSTEPDQLSQWRGYCPNGNGFSIGFKFDSIRELAIKQGFKLSRCEYILSEQINIIRKFIEEALQVYREMLSLKDLASWPKCSLTTDENLCSICLQTQDPKQCSTRKAWFKFLEIAPCLKHGKFSEEKEWRLISERISHDDAVGSTPPQESRIKFKEGKSMLVPYIEFDISVDQKLDCIQDIWIGPTPHPILSFMSIGQYLTAKDMLGDNHHWDMEKWHEIIKRSTIPYRAW